MLEAHRRSPHNLSLDRSNPDEGTHHAISRPGAAKAWPPQRGIYVYLRRRVTFLPKKLRPLGHGGRRHKGICCIVRARPAGPLIQINGPDSGKHSLHAMPHTRRLSSSYDSRPPAPFLRRPRFLDETRGSRRFAIFLIAGDDPWRFVCHLHSCPRRSSTGCRSRSRRRRWPSIAMWVLV